MRYPKAILILLLVPLLTAPLSGVETTFWQVGTFEEFLKGTLRDVSVSKEGELTLAPEAQVVFNPEEALALSLAADAKGNFYIGTGHQGRVFRVDAKQQGSRFFAAQESDIFALAVGPDGALYVGSSPEGKIYRVTPDGQSSVFFEPKTKYIWALTFDAAGNLYAGTGDQGKIFKIDRTGKGQPHFDSNQTHIMCLTFDREGNLLAGSVPDGLVYRITPQGKGFVLHRSDLPEIHDLAVDSQGRIYAAALGGAGGKGTPTFFAPPAPGVPATPVATVTVTAGTGETPAPAAQAPPQGAATPSMGRPAPQTTGFPMPLIPQGRGSLIQILPDYSTETLWSSNNETIFGLAVRDDRVLFSTDSNGRIFHLTPSRDGHKLALLTQTRESLATRLLLDGPTLLIATSNVAKLFRVGAAPAREANYESQVKDAKFVSRWGVISWRAEALEGSSLEFYTRSGNSERPDNTWSDWAGPYREPNGTPISSPPARYLQWKATFRTTSGSAPTLYEATVAYLPQNLPPQIRSLNVSTSSERTSPATPSPAPGAPGSIGVSPASSAGFSSSGSAAGGDAPPPTTLSWQAEDPNGDQVLYALWIKAADEEVWHLVKDKLRQPNFTLELHSLADGKYVARLVASDILSNAPEAARTAELTSAPFWIDQTPPRVRVAKGEVRPGKVTVQFSVEDTTSPLRGAEALCAGKEWQDVDADDGVADSRAETFTVRFDGLEPGEHIVTLRAYDTAGNAGVQKAVVRIPAGTENRR